MNHEYGGILKDLVAPLSKARGPEVPALEEEL